MILKKFFISYSHGNSEEERLARFLHSEFMLSGHDSFIDVGIKSGIEWVKEITNSINWCDYFVILLSDSALNSEMVQAQLRIARQCHHETGRSTIIPIRLRYFGPLDYGLESCLGHLQYIKWESAQDSKRILNEIFQILESHTSSEGEKHLEPADWVRDDQKPLALADYRCPQPSIDPRVAYVPGGTLRYDDPYYIRRPADDLVEEIAEKTGDTFVIKTPRQMGKTSLLLNYLAKCQQVGKKTVFIDLSIFSPEDLATYPGFLSKIATILMRTLRIARATAPEMNSQRDMTWLIEDHVLPVSDDPVVFAFDDVDRVLGKEYQEDFFSMLRLWHDNRANITLSWNKADLVLVSSTEPYFLIKEADNSPFNLTPPIEPHSFDLEQCHELNRKYEVPLLDDQVEQLWELLHGHPYLTRLAYYRMCGDEKVDFMTFYESATADRGPFGDHLYALLVKLYVYPELLNALKHVIRGEEIPPDEDLEPYYWLHGAGLIREEEHKIIPANLLYANYFKNVL